MSNRDIYKDEYGNYHEIEEELEDPTDSYEDDEQDYSEEEDSEDPFHAEEYEEDEDSYDEDAEYARGGGNDYDVDDD